MPVNVGPCFDSPVCCCGAKFARILNHQLIEEDKPGRLAWGTASKFVMITIGGNDVGILYLVLPCIYWIPIIGRGCDTITERGFTILESQDLKMAIRTVRY